MRDSLLTWRGPLDPQRHKANSAPSLLKPMNSPYGLSQFDLSFWHWQLRMLTNSVAKTLKCLNTHTHAHIFSLFEASESPSCSAFPALPAAPCLSWPWPARTVPPETLCTHWPGKTSFTCPVGYPDRPEGKRTKEDQPKLVWTWFPKCRAPVHPALPHPAAADPLPSLGSPPALQPTRPFQPFSGNSSTPQVAQACALL